MTSTYNIALTDNDGRNAEASTIRAQSLNHARRIAEKAARLSNRKVIFCQPTEGFDRT